MSTWEQITNENKCPRFKNWLRWHSQTKITQQIEIEDKPNDAQSCGQCIRHELNQWKHSLTGKRLILFATSSNLMNKGSS